MTIQTMDHQDDFDEVITAHMPEIIDSYFFPVKSYLKYMSKLGQRNDVMWQHAKYPDKIKDADIWY